MRALSPGPDITPDGRGGCGLAGECGCPLETEEGPSERRGPGTVRAMLVERFSRTEDLSAQGSPSGNWLNLTQLASFRLLRNSAWTLPVQPSVFKKVKLKNQAISHKNAVQISGFTF